MMKKNFKLLRLILIVSFLVLGSFEVSGQPEEKESVLSWSFDRKSRSYTNNQTGIHLPLKVGGFKRSGPKKNENSVFTYRRRKNVITVNLNAIPNSQKGMALEGDFFLESRIEAILWNAGGAFDKVERLSLRWNVDDRITEGLGLMANIRKFGPRENQTYAGFAMFEVGGFLFACNGNFRGKRSAEEFMNFLSELGVEKVIYNCSPKLKDQVRPEYPEELKEAGVRGVVKVEFLVSKEGKVVRATAIESPDPRLSALAEKRILSSIFSPGIKNGFLAEYELQMPVSFGSNNQIISDELIATLNVLGPNDRAPMVSYQVAPLYPKTLKKEGIESSTIVEIVISKRGYVVNAKAIESSHPEFGVAAEEMIMSWVFEPAIKDGVPIACRLQVPIDFVLKEAREDGIFDLSELDQIPRPIRQVAPIHPYKLKKAGINGEVTLQFVVSEKGNVLDVKVIESTHPDFAVVAITAIEMWKFEPGMKEGARVACRMQMPFGFRVSNRPRR